LLTSRGDCNDLCIFLHVPTTYIEKTMGEQDYTKIGLATMIDTTQQHKHANNKTRRGVGRSCSLLEVMAMVKTHSSLHCCNPHKTMHKGRAIKNANT